MRLLLALMLVPVLVMAQDLVNPDGTINLVNLDGTTVSVGVHLMYQDSETGLVYAPSGKGYKLSGEKFCAGIRFPESPSEHPPKVLETFPDCRLLEVER